MLRSYVNYYHTWRTHLSLEMDAPESRAVQHSPPVYEEGAAEDYAMFNDGPVRRNDAAVEDPSETDDDPSALSEDARETRTEESEFEGCLPAFTRGCQRDTDCCGASVCRSEPGSISGNTHCTPE